MPAHDANAVSAIETDLLIEALYRHSGMDFRAYRKPDIERKLALLCERAGLASMSALQGALLREPRVCQQVSRSLSNSESALFALPSTLIALRCAALPVLRAASWPSIWLAECADDKLLLQLVAMLEEEGLLAKTQLFVTSAHDALVREVAALRLTHAQMEREEERFLMAGGQRGLRAYCNEDAGGFQLKASVRANIVGSQYDLASGASFREFELIVCQRPLNCLELSSQRRAVGLFRQSLCNFGILHIDSPDDAIVSELTRDFLCVLADQGLYRLIPSGSGQRPFERRARARSGQRYCSPILRNA
ncbi:MAG TPA: hypothetical protein VF800_09555 [Telluria sp.]|jgi:chemotaxis protein methyltransferase CheR